MVGSSKSLRTGRRRDHESRVEVPPLAPHHWLPKAGISLRPSGAERRPPRAAPRRPGGQSSLRSERCSPTTVGTPCRQAIETSTPLVADVRWISMSSAVCSPTSTRHPSLGVAKRKVRAFPEQAAPTWPPTSARTRDVRGPGDGWVGDGWASDGRAGAGRAGRAGRAGAGWPGDGRADDRAGDGWIEDDEAEGAGRVAGAGGTVLAATVGRVTGSLARGEGGVERSASSALTACWVSTVPEPLPTCSPTRPTAVHPAAIESASAIPPTATRAARRPGRAGGMVTVSLRGSRPALTAP